MTLAIASNPGGGALSGGAVIGAVAGVASFSTLSINKSALGYTLSAAAGGVTGTTSAQFNITPGPAAALAFTVQPTTATTNANFLPTVKVAARDALGNTATGFNGNITVSLGANPGGSTLSGTKTFAAVNGVASYPGLSLNNIGTGYTLSAAAGGLAGTASTAFNIIASTALKLSFAVQPGRSTAGAAIPGSLGPNIQVEVQDASGQTVTSFTGNITVALSANPGSGTLSGTKTVAATAGTATFLDLNIDKNAVGYSLTATASGLTSATSASFTVDPGAASQLLFTLSPSTTTAAGIITPRVEVSARDAQGNLATGFTGNVTLAIGTNPATGTLSGLTTVAAANGVASFSTLSIDNAGTGYTLTAAASGLPGATSGTFDITATRATRLLFSVQPTGATAGVVIAPAVKVTAQDASGQTATSFTGAVTLTITAGTGTLGATLSGTTTVNAVNGVATFSNLDIKRSGSGYKLSAVAAGVSGALSASFTINPAAPSAVDFVTQPASTTAATTILGLNGPTITVAVKDSMGNPVKSFAGTVTLTISTNPGGGTLSGTSTVDVINGIATYNDLSINIAGTGYRLTASTTGLAPVVSDAFSITGGTATQLLFTVQPSSVGAGALIAPALRVTALDAQGNVATGFTGSVTVAIGTNPSGGALAGVATVAAANGVATFSGLSITPAGIGYTLQATSGGLTPATSATFNIN